MTRLVRTPPQMQTGPAILQPIIEIWVTFRMRGKLFRVGGDSDSEEVRVGTSTNQHPSQTGLQKAEVVAPMESPAHFEESGFRCSECQH